MLKPRPSSGLALMLATLINTVFSIVSCQQPKLKPKASH